MSKKLNITSITNELEESAFFPFRRTTPPSPVKEPDGEVKKVPENIPPKQSFVAQPERPNAQTGKRSASKRIITRNSFEIYEDQMESLRRLSFKEKMEGKLGSMSGMVRESIDEYLKKHPVEK